MNRIAKAVGTAAVAIGVAATGVSIAQPAGAQPAKALNGVDANWLRANEQTNLAEITLAGIVFKRSNGPAALALAARTTADHVLARRANVALSTQIGVRPPTEPNAMQQKAAAQLMTAPRVNRQYFILQISGHKLSIAATKYEILHGIRPRVRAFAKYYLPIAQMHLVMAERDLAAWTKIHG